jgi:hypothetical protein
LRKRPKWSSVHLSHPSDHYLLIMAKLLSYMNSPFKTTLRTKVNVDWSGKKGYFKSDEVNSEDFKYFCYSQSFMSLISDRELFSP